MPREFNINIGGKERTLRYSYRKDALPLYRRFGRGMFALCIEAMGTNSGFNPEVATALLFHALHHDLPKLTEERVADWIQDLIDAGQDLREVTRAVISAAFHSGIVTGKSEPSPFDKTEADEEGKAPETEEPTETSRADTVRPADF